MTHLIFVCASGWSDGGLDHQARMMRTAALAGASIRLFGRDHNDRTFAFPEPVAPDVRPFTTAFNPNDRIDLEATLPAEVTAWDLLQSLKVIAYDLRQVARGGVNAPVHLSGHPTAVLLGLWLAFSAGAQEVVCYFKHHTLTLRRDGAPVRIKQQDA